MPRTDLNAANDMWRPPRFPSLTYSTSTQQFLDPLPTWIGGSILGAVEAGEFGFAPTHASSKSTIDSILLEIKALNEYLTTPSTSLTPNQLPSISTSDKIHHLERQLTELI